MLDAETPTPSNVDVGARNEGARKSNCSCPSGRGKGSCKLRRQAVLGALGASVPLGLA
jgi:hypothetical protein